MTMEPKDLESAADQLGKRIPAAQVRLRQAELALRAGDLPGAEVAIAHASMLPLTRADASRLATFEFALGKSAKPESGLLAGLPDMDDILFFFNDYAST